MMIQVENLVKRYGDVVALDHFNLQIAEGEIFWPAGAQWIGENHRDQLYAFLAEI